MTVYESISLTIDFTVMIIMLLTFVVSILALFLFKKD